MYFNRKGWDARRIRVRINYSRDYEKDCESCEAEDTKVDVFERIIHIDGDLDEKQQERVIYIANKCPVHQTLENTAKITTRLGKD